MTRMERHHRQSDGPPWVVRATRYLMGVVAVVAMVAGWKAAMRWIASDGRLAERSGGDRRAPLPLLDGGTAEPEAPVPVVPVASEGSTRPSRSGARWTAEDDAYLVDHRDEPPGAIASHLGRTTSAIILRRAALKREGQG